MEGSCEEHAEKVMMYRPTQKVEEWLFEAVDRFQRAFYSGAPGPGGARTRNWGGNCWEAGFE